MNFKNKKKMIKWVTILLIVLLLIVIIPVSIPLLLALLTAIMLDPLVRILKERFKMSRNFSVLIVFFIFVLVMAVSGYFIVTKATTQLLYVIEHIPYYVSVFSRLWQEMLDKIYAFSVDLPNELVEEGTKQISALLETFKTGLLTYLNIDTIKQVFTKIPAFLVNFLVYLIALFFIMADLERLKAAFYEKLTEQTEQKVKFIFNKIASFFTGFFKAQILVSLVIFAVTLIGLLLINPKIALVMSLIIWIIDLIPIIGSIVIMAPWSIFYYVSGDPVMGTKLLLLGIVLLIIRRTVEPKVMGKHMGLSPVATLASLFIGIQIFGGVGLLLGPLLVIIYKAMRESGMIKLDVKL
ncbi:sporulation integral membrane protein YtvI [Brevibacillus laterosporus]|nr:sporulation integral membrane protein YtvI [Brevibacillus laterosporus]TPG68213.1 sporulation integral membrane protein YtvI [Brevibacillus laterosporus]TPG88659.1 sporulation integral membrane protein YtvI [Brevibacillus laterosporus]